MNANTQKYGLIKRQSNGAKQPAKQPSVFGQFEEDEDESSSHSFRQVSQQAFRKSASGGAGIDKLAAKALEEDPSVFDYDGNYDSFKQVEKSRLASMCQEDKRDAPKPRYVENLLVAAKIREKERDRVYERKLLKERLEEDKLLGIDSEETTKFMTSAYKEKLLEDQKWKYEEKLIEEVDKRTNAENKGMHGFYANLLTKNISMGGNVAENAISAYTAGSLRQQKVLPTSTNKTTDDTPTKVPNMLEANEQSSNIYPNVKPTTTNKQIHEDIDDHRAPKLESKQSADSKQSKEKAVIAAKERYLARKRSVEAAEL